VRVYVLILGGPLGEELGWRGWLLPRLEEGLGALAATLLTAAAWTLWHLPLFFIAGTVQTLVPFWVFAAQIFVTSFFYTWLLHRTRHSLVPVMAFHMSFNLAVGIALVQPPGDLAVRPLLIALSTAAVLAVVLARTSTFRTSESAEVPTTMGPVPLGKPTRTDQPGTSSRLGAEMAMRRWLASMLVLLAAGVGTATVLGPLVVGAIDYRTSDTTLNQIMGGDLAGLALVVPVALMAALLVWRGHRAGPVLALAPALWATYMYAQLIVGQEYGQLPGNNEQFFPLLLGLFILGGAITIIAWHDIDPIRLPAVSRVLNRTTAIVLLVLAVFLTVGLHVPGLADALSDQPTALEYTSSPTAFWIVKLMDLGIIVPAALAIGVGLLRHAPWARKASYALLGGYTLLGAAVTGMAIVMYANSDPDGTLTNVIAFTTFTIAIGALTAALYRPLFTAAAAPHDPPNPTANLSRRQQREYPVPQET